MKRVWCLYRVSTKKQVNADDDLPMQKNACHTFVQNQPDWKITRELAEKGVSGWSKSVSERDELMTIKAGAENNEFDILLVFMFDRLGRREDETPFVVSFLHQHHVEVWSVEEGKRSVETHADKLMNYLSFWVSDGESQKTSMRVRESKKQLSEQGYFQGGIAPTGYKVIETTQLHWKNKERQTKELVPDEKEAEFVKLIFSLYIGRHMGYRKIVDYLNANGFRTREGKIFGVSTIKRILENPIYIGRKRYKSFDGSMSEQPYNEKLRIIPDEWFDHAMAIKNKRREKLNGQDRQGIPLAGKLLFSGLAFCKYCGAKLSANYLYRVQKSAKNPVYRYRCPLNKGKLTGNHEQNIWGAQKYDRLIIQQVKALIRQMDIKTFVKASAGNKKAKVTQTEQNIKTLEKEYANMVKQLDKLNGEIANALVNDSAFTPKQLSAAIADLNKKMAENETNRKHLKKEISLKTDSPGEEWSKWEERFDHADDDLKKAMLSRVIDKVYFAKNELTIEFNLMFEKSFITAIMND